MSWGFSICSWANSHWFNLATDVLIHLLVVIHLIVWVWQVLLHSSLLLHHLNFSLLLQVNSSRLLVLRRIFGIYKMLRSWRRHLLRIRHWWVSLLATILAGPWNVFCWTRIVGIRLLGLGTAHHVWNVCVLRRYWSAWINLIEHTHIRVRNGWSIVQNNGASSIE